MRSLLSRGRTWRKVVVLTGAGVSVASGLPTYRGADGLWTKDPGLAARMTKDATPADLWKLFGPLRALAARAAPNTAHGALATFEAELARRGGGFALITQNIDGLHQRAGSACVIELHGSAFRTRCTRCEWAMRDDPSAPDAPPPCPSCGAPTRPGIVLFEEPIGADEEVAAKRALRDSELFVAVGTSGRVSPAANFVRSAKYEGAHTVFVGPDRADAQGFDEVVEGKAEVVLPELLSAEATR